jgi:hypothetical protein
MTNELLAKISLLENENQRLNNVLNELEEFSEKKVIEYTNKLEKPDNKGNISMLCVRSAYRDILNKIKKN